MQLVRLRCGAGCVEAAYIIQSLVSKTLLGWLMYGGNFAPSN
jgi:hypothetical protein